MENDIFFEPYKGPKYENPNNNIFDGKRLLIVGHNHDCAEPNADPRIVCRNRCNKEKCKNMTKNVIEDWKKYKEGIVNFEKEYIRSLKVFTTFSNCLSEYKLPPSLVMDNIGFYNFIQSAVQDKTLPLQNEIRNQVEESQEAFLQLISDSGFTPDYIICWSVANVFDKLPKTNRTQPVYYKTTFGKRKYKYGVCYYNVNNKKIPVLGIQHPSQGFNCEYYHKLIKSFMNQDK